MAESAGYAVNLESAFFCLPLTNTLFSLLLLRFSAIWVDGRDRGMRGRNVLHDPRNAS